MQRRTLLATLATTTLASPVISSPARAAAGMITARDGTRLACLDQGIGKPVC